MTPRIPSLATALCIAILVSGCGGDGGDAPTSPTPTTTTLTLDFMYIEVLEDCDDLEGDGDFHFLIEVSRTDPLGSVTVYDAVVNLGTGAKHPIGRRSYTFDASKNVIVGVIFTAAELDRNIFGVEYNDERLDNIKGAGGHNYVGGTWSFLGEQSIFLASNDENHSGCRVRLHWTATAT